MSIIRIAKRREYTRIPNSTLRDEGLSLDSLGLLVRLLSYPDGWTVRMGYLQGQLGIGRHRLRRLLAELQEVQYLARSKSRGADGKWTWESVISDTPTAGNP